MSKSNDGLSGRSMRPSDFLRAAESGAVRIRKLLRATAAQHAVDGSSGSMCDAERLTELIERLARQGQKAPAVDAIRIEEYVESLIEMLRADLDCYFTD